jgi:cytidylate kinase
MMHMPIRVITVEREYGSRGGEFAHDLAKSLGWKLLDAELIAGAAHTAGVNPELAARLDERLDPWYYRYGKVFWHDSVYSATQISDDQIFDAARLQNLIQQEILKAAQEGNCVLVGRGAACALAGHPNCLHLFVYATAKAKKEWFLQAFPQQASHAEQYLAANDKRRAAFIKKFYQQEWCCRGLYHMLLNSSMGIDAMIEAVQGAARLQPVEEAVG